jgi:hypothetical protein
MKKVRLEIQIWRVKNSHYSKTPWVKRDTEIFKLIWYKINELSDLDEIHNKYTSKCAESENQKFIPKFKF